MSYEHLLYLDELEEMVDRLKARYIKVRNARRPSHHEWREYVRVLHELRLRKRSMNNGA